MISLSQILPRAQRHTSFTVTSGLAVTTETRGGGYGEVDRAVCVCVESRGLSVGVGVGLGPSASSRLPITELGSGLRRVVICKRDL